MDTAKSTSVAIPPNEKEEGIKKLFEELSQEYFLVTETAEIGSQKHMITSVEAHNLKLVFVELIEKNGISSQDMTKFKDSLMSPDPVVVIHSLNRIPSEDEAKSFFHRGFDDWYLNSTNWQWIKALIPVLSYNGPCIDCKKITSLESQTSTSCVTDLFDALINDCVDAKTKVFQIGPDTPDCNLKAVSCDLHVCSQILGSPYLFQLCEFVNNRIQQGPPWSRFFQEILFQGIEKLTSELYQVQSTRPRFRIC